MIDNDKIRSIIYMKLMFIDHAFIELIKQTTESIVNYFNKME